jgi:hypothetical protein
VVARAPHKTDKRRFYAQALTEAEQADLCTALEVEGFDEELATLRLRLRTALDENPKDLALVLRGMDVLRRMVATKYGLSREDRQAFQSAFAQETLLRMQERGEGGGQHDAA